jgi:Tol biopolymer transport system component/DNA-binding winged helix-turn-helix (wHTH) protein
MPEQSLSAGLVRFGVFELDRRSGELRKAGVRISLQEQALQVLTSLLERPGDLVTREELRQRLWPNGTFGDFDHGLNAVVNRLRDTLGDSADSPRFIETLPRRGYRFIAPIESDRIASPAVAPGAPVSVPEGPAASPSARRRRGRIVAAFAVGFVAVMTGALWQLRRPPGVEGPPPKVVSLTRLAGDEDWPAFSPDGEQVAFSWTGEKSDNVDIYVTLVGATELRRLTTDPAVDYAPSWSPDGRRIAFLRTVGRAPGSDVTLRKDQDRPFQGITEVKIALLDAMDSASGSLHVMSALGGSDRRLTELPVVGRVSWSPDGRYLAVGRAPSAASVSEPPGIYLIPTRGGESRPLTRAISPSYDAHPAFSPDGRRLAYASCNRVEPCHIAVLDLDAGAAAAGPAHRLPEAAGTRITGLAWTRDGRSLIFANMGTSGHLWRVGVDATAAPERIEIAGVGDGPAIASSRDRLAFSRSQVDTDIDVVARGKPPVRVVASSADDDQPALSPDGRRIAFCSSRSGDAMDVWVAGSDGSNARQLTRGPGRWQCSPHWSPDGGRIAFDSLTADGTFHIWTMDADGGTARQLTTDAGSQTAPTWSHDGQWIYFAWNQGTSRDIWRTRVTGGPHERLTRGGSGPFGVESADAGELLYQAKDGEAPLLAKSLGGGPIREVVPCVAWGGAFLAAPQGVYYVACGSGSHADAQDVHLLHSDGRDELIATLEQPLRYYYGLAVSQDGRSIWYSKSGDEGSDLMMIENFR